MSEDPMSALLATITGSLTQVDNRLIGIQDGQTKLRADLMDSIDRIEHGQTTLRADLTDRIEHGQTKLRADLMDRIDRLQNTVTAMRDDVAVNFGASDAVRRVHDNTREELRGLGETMSLLFRKLNRVEQDIRGLKGEA